MSSSFNVGDLVLIRIESRFKKKSKSFCNLANICRITKIDGTTAHLVPINSDYGYENAEFLIPVSQLEPAKVHSFTDDGVEKSVYIWEEGENTFGILLNPDNTPISTEPIVIDPEKLRTME